jgi:hypothetical protein
MGGSKSRRQQLHLQDNLFAPAVKCDDLYRAGDIIWGSDMEFQRIAKGPPGGLNTLHQELRCPVNIVGKDPVLPPGKGIPATVADKDRVTRVEDVDTDCRHLLRNRARDDRDAGDRDPQRNHRNQDNGAERIGQAGVAPAPVIHKPRLLRGPRLNRLRWSP